MSRWLLLAGVLAVGGVASCVALRPTQTEHDNRLPDEVRALLSGADQMELLSLDPHLRRPATPLRPETGVEPVFVIEEPAIGEFHTWPVLGRTTLIDPHARQQVVAAIEKGLADSDGTARQCFYPHHGLHASCQGKTVDLVICYECNQLLVYIDRLETYRLTATTSQPVLNAILKEAGVPLARQPGQEGL